MFIYKLAMLLALATPSPPTASPTKSPVVLFATAYSAEHSEFGRRGLCLRAIDMGLIKPGMSVSTLDQLFGTNFSAQIPSNRLDSGWRAIDFAQQPVAPPSPVAIQVPFVGWYFAFNLDGSGHIWDYHLSNIHK